MGAWQNKQPVERKTILRGVRACGAQAQTWRGTAAHLGVSWETLKAWKRDDPEGKIAVAYQVGRSELAGRIASRIIEKALNPEESGNTRALIELSRHYLDMAPGRACAVVSPADIEDPDLGPTAEDSAASSRQRALEMLGLEALDGG